MINKFSVSFLLLVGGCSVGPDYVPPEFEVPSTFSTPESEVTGKTKSKEFNDSWWKQFKDKELDKLVLRAVENNKSLKQAASRITQSRAVARLAKANLLPGVDLQGTYTRSRSSAFGFPGDGGESFDFELYSGAIRSSWEFDLFGRLRRQLEADKALVEQAEELLLDTQRLLIADVAEAYFQLLTANGRLAITRKSLETQKQSLRVVETKFKFGESSKLEFAQAQTRYFQTSALIPSFIEASKLASHRLAYLVGETPNKVMIETGNELPEVPNVINLSTPGDLIRSRPDIVAAERLLASSTARIGVAMGDLYPKITISGSLGRDAANLTPLSLSTEVFSLAPQITWTPFDTGRLRSVVIQTEAITEESLYRWEDTVLRALVEVEDALAQYNSYTEQVKHYRSAMNSASEALSVSSKQYDEGLIDYLTYLDSQRTALDVEDALILSQQALLSSVVNLYSSLGYF